MSTTEDPRLTCTPSTHRRMLEAEGECSGCGETNPYWEPFPPEVEDR